MSKLYVLLFIITLCLPHLSRAQFKLGAEIRPRAELRNGFKTPKIEGAQPAFLLSDDPGSISIIKSIKFN